MPKKKFNYAIVRSIFGDHWIGKTELPVKDGSIFSNHDDALKVAKQFTSYDSVAEMESDYENDNIGEIDKEVEKFII